MRRDDRYNARLRETEPMRRGDDTSQREDVRLIRPDGLGIRGRRHARGWSPRDLVEAIGRAATRETGVWETITPNLLLGVEEQNESIPWQTLRLIAAGLDCNPAELLAWDDAQPVRGGPGKGPARRPEKGPRGLA